MDGSGCRGSFERAYVHGQVTALSEVVETGGGRSLVLVGSLSRVYVCELDGLERSEERWRDRHSAVVATRDGVLPHGSTVHGIVVRRSSAGQPEMSSEDVCMYHVVAYGGRYVAVLGLEVTLGAGGLVVARLADKAVQSFPKWVLAVDVDRHADGRSLYMAAGMIDNSVEVCRVVRRDEDGLWWIYAQERRYGDRRCMLYSMDIVGFLVDDARVYDVRVAGGTVLFDVVVWRVAVRVEGSDRDVCDRKNAGDDVFGGERSMVCGGGHTGSVHCVCWDAGGNRVASGSDDRTVRVWVAPWVDIRPDQRIGGVTEGPWFVFAHQRRVWSLQFVERPGGGAVYSGLEDGCVTGWDVGTLEDPRAATGNTVGSVPIARWGSGKGVRAVRAFKQRLLTGGADGSVRVWDACGGTRHTTAAVVVLRACFGRCSESDPISTHSVTIGALAEQKRALGTSFESIKVMCLVEGGRTLLAATDKGRLVSVDVATNAQHVVYAAGPSRPLVNIKAYDCDDECVLACCDARGALHLLRSNETGPGGLNERLASHVIDGPVRMIDSFFVSHGTRTVLICLTASGPLVLCEVRKDGLDPVPLCRSPSPFSCRITSIAYMNLETSSESAHTSMSGIQPASTTTLVVMGSAKGGVAAWLLTEAEPGGHGLRVSLVACQAQDHGATPVQTISLQPLQGARVAIETTAMDFCIQRYSLHVAPGSLALNRNNETRIDAIKSICAVHTVRARGPEQDRNYVSGFFAATFLIWDRDLDVKVCEFSSSGWKRPWAFAHVDDQVTFCYTSGVGDIHVFSRHIQRHPPFEIVPGGHVREMNSVVHVTGGPGQGLLVTAGADARLFASQWRRGMLDARCISTQPFGTSTRVLKAIRLTPTSALVVSGGARSIMTAWKAVEDDRNGHYSLEYLSAFANPTVCKWDVLKSQASNDTVDMRVTALALGFSRERVSITQKMDRDSTADVIVAIALSTGEMELRRIPCTHTHRRLHDWPLVAQAPTSYPVISMVFHDSRVWAGTTNGELIAWNPGTGHVDTYPAIHACGVNAMALVPSWNAIVTGGDDQSLSVFCLSSRTQRCTVPNAHASAIKDLCVLGEDRPVLCTIGLDQYLRAWRVTGHDMTLTCIGSALLQVQEPAACCVTGPSTITVVGRGIEQAVLTIKDRRGSGLTM